MLFAYREVPVEGLGFSLFDLVFGRNVKGVLQLIRTSWLKGSIPNRVKYQNVIDYVLDSRERIRTSMDIVNPNEQKAKKRSKFWYDKNAKPISYAEGERVLVLLPQIGKPLQAKYFGPYVVEKRLGEVNCVVKHPTDVNRGASFM